MIPGPDSAPDPVRDPAPPAEAGAKPVAGRPPALERPAPPEPPVNQKQPERLKKRADFLRVAKGRRFAMPGLVLQMAPRPPANPGPSADPHPPLDPGSDGAADDRAAPARLGFTVTKKVGIAVVRNRARRRLRAAAAAVMPRLAKPATDYVLIGREGTLDRPFPDLIRDLETALARIETRPLEGPRPPRPKSGARP